jgi:hypothetical protein
MAITRRGVLLCRTHWCARGGFLDSSQLGAARRAWNDRFSPLLLVSQLRPLLTAATAGAIILTLVRVVLLVLWLWYLFRRPVRDAFRMNPARATGV